MGAKPARSELIHTLDFDEPDGLSDPHLPNYFIDFRC